MSHASSALAPKPDHVPANVVFPLDFTAPPGGEDDIHLAWKRVQDAAPDIIWTPYHGGHWIMLRAEDIEFVQKNHDPFSMRSITVPTGMTPMRVIPLETDPPEHTGFRAVINPTVSPKVVSGLQDSVRKLAAELIDGFYPKGECEFVSEFALQLPIAIFMRLADLPMADRQMLLEWAEIGVRPKTADDRAIAFGNMNRYIDRALVERRTNPGPDLISAVIHGKVAGRALTEAEIRSMLMNLLFGGLDTVASSMGFFAYFLARNPRHRRQLIERPELIPNAVEELLRRHGVSSTARVISRDFEYKGLLFKKGDCVLQQPMLYGLDERRFDNPLDVDFERKNVIHAAFGNGPHRCPGSMLARSELRVFLEEWLKRIPDFQVKPGEHAVFSPGLVNAMSRLPLAWNMGS